MSERRCGMEMKDLSRAEWRTSSYSGSNGNCVEVAADPGWRKSSHSGTNGNCVEVAADPGARVLLRDTKDRKGPVLAFRPGAWRRFAEQVKAGTLHA
jgi:hypothetical protein